MNNSLLHLTVNDGSKEGVLLPVAGTARRRNRLAEVGAARGALAIISDGIAPGARCFIIAPDARQHRREHFPAPTIGRILFEMGFDLRDELVHRSGCDGRAAALYEVQGAADDEQKARRLEVKAGHSTREPRRRPSQRRSLS